MRRVEKNRASARTGSQEQLPIVQIRPELVILSKLAGDHAGAAPLNLRAVGREVRTENQHLIARIKESFTEELLEKLRPRADDHIFGSNRKFEFLSIISGDSLAESRQPQGRAIMGLLIFNGLDTGGGRGSRRGKRTVADL